MIAGRHRYERVASVAFRTMVGALRLYTGNMSLERLRQLGLVALLFIEPARLSLDLAGSWLLRLVNLVNKTIDLADSAELFRLLWLLGWRFDALIVLGQKLVEQLVFL